MSSESQGQESWRNLRAHDRIDLMKQIMFFSVFNPFVVITCHPLNSSHWMRTFSEVEVFVILRPGLLSTRNSCRIYKEGMERKESSDEKEPRRMEKHVLLDGL